MTSITEFMQGDHRACDETFSKTEESVASGDWVSAKESWDSFRNELYSHIDEKEEKILFPAFEEVNGPAGPTVIMRGEHQQMRALVSEIDKALENRDTARFLGLGEQLMITIQQHNMKEEQILYPLMDRRIANVSELVGQLS
ncbi:MAG: hemerythrin domain-containing protein [Pseudomonadales bacterium]|nr:hemerythrin domain-containing protein [Pseudomonadales bacterium]